MHSEFISIGVLYRYQPRIRYVPLQQVPVYPFKNILHPIRKSERILATFRRMQFQTRELTKRAIHNTALTTAIGVENKGVLPSSFIDITYRGSNPIFILWSILYRAIWAFSVIIGA